MKETLERELKLSVGPDFALPPLQVETTPRHLRATYYDTPDHRLAAHGVTLRRRLEDNRELWQLKLPAGRDRLELEREANGPDVPAEFVGLVTAYARGAALLPVAELHTLRRAVRVTADGVPAAEVVHDTVEVRDGDRVVRSFSEVEIEQISAGAERLIARLERQLRAAGGARSDGRPKVFQALDLPAARQNLRPKRDAPALEHVRAYLQTQIDSLLENDPATRRGGVEGVHAMRVATRRLRSALKAASRLLDPAWVTELRDELTWLGGALGEVRDADVFAAYVEQEVGDLGAGAAHGGAELTTLVRQRAQTARERLKEVLDSPRYVALLDRLESVDHALPVARSEESLARVVRRAVRRAERKLRGVSSRSSDADLHRLRLASKRARYAGELAESREGRDARRIAVRAAALQGVLGEHQDAVVAEERLQSIAGEATPAGAFAAGRLAERQRDRRAAARAALPRAAKRFARAAQRL